MDKLLVIGAGGHSRSVISIAKSMNRYADILIIDHESDRKYSDNEVMGYEILRGLDSMNDLSANEYAVFVAVGDNRKRQAITSLVLDWGYRVESLMHASAIIDSSAQIGKGVFVGALARLNAESIIGDGTIVNTGVNIEHEASLGRFSHMAPGAIVCGRSRLGARVFVGANATIIDNIHIVDDVTVGAATLIRKDITMPGARIVGNPARLI